LTERNIIFKQKHIFKKVSITIAGKVIDYHKMIYIFNNIDDATNFNIEFNPGVYVRWSKDNRMEDEEDEEDDNF
jgi:hypothetical protein